MLKLLSIRYTFVNIDTNNKIIIFIKNLTNIDFVIDRSSFINVNIGYNMKKCPIISIIFYYSYNIFYFQIILSLLKLYQMIFII